MSAQYTPDCAYATWTRTMRRASDRMEADYNDNARVVLARRDETQGHTVHGQPDDSLRRLATIFRRELEDIAEGALPRARRPLAEARLRDVERESEFRRALAESWLAAESGTHCYSAFDARGGLEAVLNHGAPPPSYSLAVTLDWELMRRGEVHVLAWGEAA